MIKNKPDQKVLFNHVTAKVEAVWTADPCTSSQQNAYRVARVEGV